MEGVDFEEGLRGLVVVEAVGEVVGEDVSGAEGWEVEVFFDVGEEAAGLVGDVGDVAGFGVGGDDEEWDAEAEAHVVDLGGRDVIVPAAPVVPGDEDGGGVPEGAVADGVDYGGDPVGAFGERAGVVGVIEGGDDPGDLGELALGDVGEDVGLWGDDLGGPVLAVADVADGIEGGDDVEAVGGTGGVVPPGDTFSVEEVGHGGVVEAGEDSGEVSAVGAYEGDAGGGGGVATPGAGAVGIFGGFAGLAGDHVLMGDEAGSGVGLEHAVAEGVTLSEVPVGLHVGLGDIRVGEEGGGGDEGGGAGFFSEAVHLAVVPIGPPAGVGVVDVGAATEGHRCERDDVLAV